MTKSKNCVLYLAGTQWYNYVKAMTKVVALTFNKANSTIVNLFSKSSKSSMHHSFLEYVKLVKFVMVLIFCYVEDKHVVSIQFQCLKILVTSTLKQF